MHEYQEYISSLESFSCDRCEDLPNEIPTCEPPRAERVLVFAPHPDDEVFGCGGLLHYYTQQGSHCHIVIATSGDFGLHGASGPLVREEESRTAGHLLGYDQLCFWRIPDRSLCYSETLIVRVHDKIEKFAADIVLAPWPGERHPDHRSLSWGVIEAVRRLQSPAIQLLLYEISAPLSRPNLYVDISEQMAIKQQAMSCFSSQLTVQAYDRHVAALNSYRSFTLPADVQAAEAFWQLSAKDIANPVLLALGGSAAQVPQCLTLNPLEQKVSVLIRSMNRTTLSRALVSVALQTYPDIEVLVLNAAGGEHQSLADHCGCHPLHFLDSAETLPRSRAANRLLAEALGDYVIFLDDDDWFLPDHLTRLVNALDRAPDTHAAVTGVAYGQLTTEGWQVSHLFDSPYNPNRLLLENYMPIHGVMIRLDSIRSFGCLFDEQLDLFEDWDFWLQLSNFTDFIHVPGVSACYCETPEGTSVQTAGAKQVQQRNKLLSKWQGQLSTERYCELIDFAQKHYRQVKDLKSKVTARDCEISELKTLVTARDTEIAELKPLVAARDMEIAELKPLVAARDMEITDWQQRASDVDQVVAARDHEIAELKTLVTARDTEITHWQQRAADQEHIIAAKNTENDELRSKSCYWEHCPFRRRQGK